MRQQTALARGLAWPAPRFNGRQTSAAHKHSLCFFFSSVSEHLSRASTYICKNEDVSVYWLWLLLHTSAVSVVIVIIAICDMPRQELSLRERVYIHNTYMNSRKSCSETRKFRIKFLGRRVPNPSTIRRQAKRFKETGSIKNRKVNYRCHVLTLKFEIYYSRDGVNRGE